RAEHAVLVPAARVAAALGARPADCLAGFECRLAVAAEVEARLVLALELPPPSAGSESAGCVVRGEVVDVAAAQVAARAEVDCAAGEDRILDATLRLVRRLVGEAANQPRGALAVTSTPAG